MMKSSQLPVEGELTYHELPSGVIHVNCNKNESPDHAISNGTIKQALSIFVIKIEPIAVFKRIWEEIDHWVSARRCLVTRRQIDCHFPHGTDADLV
jgi:hypothetical protein